MLGQLGAIKRHLEEEPQRRDGDVDLWRACTARRQMQPKTAHVLRLGRGGRAAEERGEVLDPLHVVMLGFWRELADRHVFDHAPAQRTDGLLGHGDAPVLTEVVDPLDLKTGRPVPLWCWPRRMPQRFTARAV